MKDGELRGRTKAFAVRIIRLYASLPKSAVAQTIGRQMLRSGTSVGANYHEALGARSRTEFAAKLGVVMQELYETEYWVDLLSETETVKRSRLGPLLEELCEIRAMTAASRKTAASKRGKP